MQASTLGSLEGAASSPLGLSFGAGSSVVVSSRSQVQLFDGASRRCLSSWAAPAQRPVAAAAVQHPTSRRLYAALGKKARRVCSWAPEDDGLDGAMRELSAPVARLLVCPQVDGVIVVHKDASACACAADLGAGGSGAALPPPGGGGETLLEAQLVAAGGGAAGETQLLLLLFHAGASGAAGCTVCAVGAGAAPSLELLARHELKPPTASSALRAAVFLPQCEWLALTWSCGAWVCGAWSPTGAEQFTGTSRALAGFSSDCATCAASNTAAVMVGARPSDDGPAAVLSLWDVRYGTMLSEHTAGAISSGAKTAGRAVVAYSETQQRVAASCGGTTWISRLATGGAPTLLHSLGRMRSSAKYFVDSPADSFAAKLGAAKSEKAFRKALEAQLDSADSDGQSVVEIAVGIAAKRRWWGALQWLIETERVSAITSQALLSALQEHAQLSLIERYLRYVPDLPEDPLVGLVRFFLSQVDSAALDAYRGQTGGDEPALELFLSLIVARPVNHVFLTHSLRSLTASQAVALLKFLHLWLRRYHRKTPEALEIEHIVAPAFSQVLDWTMHMLDAHLIDILVLPAAHKLVGQLSELVGEMKGSCSALAGLQGVLKQFKREIQAPGAAVGSEHAAYLVQVISY